MSITSTRKRYYLDPKHWRLSAGTGKLWILGNLGLVFVWRCFVSCLLFLLFYVSLRNLCSGTHRRNRSPDLLRPKSFDQNWFLFHKGRELFGLCHIGRHHDFPLFSQAVFLMINESKDFSTLMVCHQLEPSWRQETHITGKKPVLLVTNL